MFKFITIICAYALEAGCSNEDKDAFWEDIDEAMANIPLEENKFILGDLTINNTARFRPYKIRTTQGKLAIIERVLKVVVVVDQSRDLVRVAKVWNELPASIFPDKYSPGTFKSRINGYLLDRHVTSSSSSSLTIRYKVYNVKLDTEEEQERFQLIKNDRDALDFWRLPSWERNIVGRVMVPASHHDWFEQKSEELSIDVDVYIEDVLEYLIEKDKTTNVRDGTSRDFNLSGYYRYDEILNQLRELEASYTSSLETNFEIIEFGTTSQGRPLVYVKINRSNSDGTKPVVIIEAGINPREWITIPSAVNVVYNILNEGQSRFLDNFDWIVIPVANPDGYEYTHTNLRLWEKSRSTNSNLGFICPGVNINRNFDIDWGVSGASSSPCSNIYAGVGPLSEIESQMIATIIEEYNSRLDLYISLQNNGGVISYPWYYERAATGMFRNNHLLGLQIVNAMTSNYTLGVSSVVVDRTSGTGSDYARTNGVRYTYNIDIEHSEDGNVLIPEESIARIANDVWAAVSVAADNI